MKCAIGFDDVQELKSFIEEYYTEKREIPRWQHCSFSPKGLANSDNLCSKDRGGKKMNNSSSSPLDV